MAEAARREQTGGGQSAQIAAAPRLVLGLVRLIALVGIVALAVIVGAVLVSENVQGWITGLAIGAGVELLTIVVLFSRRFGPTASR